MDKYKNNYNALYKKHDKIYKFISEHFLTNNKFCLDNLSLNGSERNSIPNEQNS